MSSPRRAATHPVPLAPGPLRGRLAPEAMYPAGDPAVSARMVTVASGLRVRVVESGPAAGPPVVLLHGWCCSAYSFRRNVRALADRGCRVLVPDLKGHGLSDKPEGSGEYTLARMADHVGEIMDALGVRRAALVGHSMGGALALAVALRAPERVSRLALVAPVGFGAVSLLSVARLITPRPLTPFLPHLVRRWMVGAVLRLAYAQDRLLRARAVDEYFAPTQFPAYVRAMRALLHEFAWSPGERSDLACVAVPVLVIFGTRDRLVYRPSVVALVRAIPDVELDLVEGAGHVPQEEVPDRVNARLAPFVAAADGAGGNRVAAGGTTG